ncbi:hypothetical protein JZ751_013246 [Albula glossodonta]|uniref:SMP-LTD domain-containing protein n=1 Tax=Albula glossodonta TaxID=121402 RepID=A0A8T2P2K0_9TELE|nr:hypothetical protein JZ751_013246 [Albula glossodonta]
MRLKGIRVWVSCLLSSVRCLEVSDREECGSAVEWAEESSRPSREVLLCSEEQLSGLSWYLMQHGLTHHCDDQPETGPCRDVGSQTAGQALAEEEEEEEEEAAASVLPSASAMECDDPSVVTAEEASEDLFEIPNSVTERPASAPPLAPPTGTQPAPASTSPAHSPAHSALERRKPTPSSSSSPSRAQPSRQPFLSLVKSLSTEVEPREGVALPTSMRHRHLMKTLVKSLSTDSSSRSDQETPLLPQAPPPPSSHRPPDSLLNLQLFRQFTQPRVAASVGVSDSKTAPSSPQTSPDGRSFFKVQEVEARIEDTRRRLSEVMYEPLQRLSKIIGDEGGGPSLRAKPLSSSASELTNLASLNGHHLEANNNNYCIKEEEGSDWEGDSPPVKSWSLGRARSPSLGLDKCSMSALAKQDDEEFCELYSDEIDVIGEGEVELAIARAHGPHPHGGVVSGEEEEEDEEEEAPAVPHMTLLVLTSLVYGYFVLPLPDYMGGVLQGVAAGFLLAMLFVWLAAPQRSSTGPRWGKRRGEAWNVAQLDIQEPGIFKGWMNEIHSYDPETYHATLTHSVFVRLEGSTLRLSKPNRNIARRATFNEPKPDMSFVSQKIYDLTDSKIYLVPQSLARKRVWNKKYPICIELGQQEAFMSQTPGGKGAPEEDKPTVGAAGERGEVPGGSEEVNKPFGTPERGRTAAHREPTLFLFGRTGREKEEWFRRMTVASRLKSEARKPQSLPGSRSAFIPSHSRSNSQSGTGLSHSRGNSQSGGGLGLSQSRSSSRSSLDELLLTSQPCPRELSSGVRQKMLLDYSVYMAQYVPPQPGSPLPSSPLPSSPKEEAEPEAWVNALLGRIFWDFLGETYWASLVSKKIQMKLSKIRLPYFMNELTLKELDMGVAIPKILQASKPSVDHQGSGGTGRPASGVLAAEPIHPHLLIGPMEGEGLRFGDPGKDGPRLRAYCLADSDEESSSAGSSDEEEPPEILPDKGSLPGAEGLVGGHRPSKILRFVDKITKSKYFQKATETEFIKKMMEEVSNTPLLLTVEVQECRGKLAVNIPPPPTDRIWYGFRSPPHLELKARPKLGEREVTLAHVTDWIEKKLEQEFQKIFVMPNMDDVWLPIMHSAMDTRSNYTLDASAGGEGPTPNEM